jgi:hypothetical protein
MRMTEDDAFFELLFDCFIDFVLRIAERDRSQTVAKINVFVAVGVPDPAALAPDDHRRFVAVVGNAPGGRRGPAGEIFERSGEQGCRFLRRTLFFILLFVMKDKFQPFSH